MPGCVEELLEDGSSVVCARQESFLQGYLALGGGALVFVSSVRYYVNAHGLRLQLRDSDTLLLLLFAATEHIWRPCQQTWQPSGQNSF